MSDTAYGALTVASLPEYRRNHWGRLDTLLAAGLDGLEIVNAAPKANEFTRPERDSVIALAKAGNRFVVGVSDSHGWGATSMVWNLVPLASSAGDTCAAVLRQLRTGGFEAVRSSNATGCDRTTGGPPGSRLSVCSGRPGAAWAGH